MGMARYSPTENAGAVCMLDSLDVRMAGGRAETRLPSQSQFSFHNLIGNAVDLAAVPYVGRISFFKIVPQLLILAVQVCVSHRKTPVLSSAEVMFSKYQGFLCRTTPQMRVGPRKNRGAHLPTMLSNSTSNSKV